MAQSIPIPTIRRFPQYLQAIRQRIRDGAEFISGTDLANELEVLPIQVRKDMAFTGVAGKPKTGFPAKELAKAIEHILGWDNREDAFLIGAGSLGTALMGYKSFKEIGLSIIAAFDSDPRRINTRVHDLSVFDQAKLPELLERMRIQIAVLATPGEAAQEIVDVLVAGGVRAIWNFTPASLRVPETVVVEDVRLRSSLSVLKNRLRDMLDLENEP